MYTYTEGDDDVTLSSGTGTAGGGTGSITVEDQNRIIGHYYMKKQSTENVLPKNQWWANGNIICNVHDNILVNPTPTTNNKGHNSDPSSTSTPSNPTTSNLRQSQYWGDHFLFQLKDMFSEVCNSNRYIPDCDFFINKRDYPQLKYNNLLGMYICV